jgi:glycosyltransferase involved in cell wall biosynthesis
MKIVHIIPGLERGGAEIFLSQLVRCFSPNFENEVISLAKPGPVGTQIRRAGVRVHTMGMNNQLQGPFCIFKLAKTLKAIKPDIVQTWMYNANLIGGLAAYIADVAPVVWSVHHTDLSLSHNKLSTLLSAFCGAPLSRLIPARVIFCAKAAATSHTAVGYSRRGNVVIRNGVDTDIFVPSVVERSAARRELGIDDSVKVVGMVGRFNPQKNHRAFFEMAGLLNHRHSQLVFVLLGKGLDEENNVVRCWADEFGVTNLIRLLGSRDNVRYWLNSFDLLVSPSVGEGFSIAIAEAMACEIPCIVTDVGDSSYLVGDTGVVVAHADPQSLAAAVDNILQLSDLQRKAHGKSGRERVQSMFNIKRVVQQYEALYYSLYQNG